LKVKAIKQFIDLKENVRRKPGEEFEVTQARFKEINSTKHGVLVEKVEEPKTKEGK
jgi:hypothetical protein